MTEKDVYVAYGTVVNEIKEVSRSYKEAQHGVWMSERSSSRRKISSPTPRWESAA